MFNSSHEFVKKSQKDCKTKGDLTSNIICRVGWVQKITLVSSTAVQFKIHIITSRAAAAPYFALNIFGITVSWKKNKFETYS